jgi:ankyrin repeat protein
MRKHGATLLHYVGSNGVEYFRQRCPKNIVAIADMLLNAGAEIDALAGMYGGYTAFGLAATSIHPVQAGVLIPLLEVLLNAGASIDGADGASMINACHANGRPQAAEFLAERGARLDLEGAAGVGRLDLVRSFFNPDGTLKPTAARQQMIDGFTWACEYGRIEVAQFLLDRGVPIDTRVRNHGQTGLHWAAAGAHVELVKMLVSRGAPVDAKDQAFDGTPLGWALYGWRNPAWKSTPERYREVAAVLVSAGARVEPEWLDSEAVRKDAAMLAALTKTAG